MKPASATSGFFQDGPVLENPYKDPGLERVLRYFVPAEVLTSADEELASLGEKVISKEIFEHVEDAERNLPFIVEQDTFGHPVNRLVTSAGWKRLKEFAAEEGIIASSFERKFGQHSRLIAFTKELIFGPSSAIVSCPLAMADGCARLIEMQNPAKDSWMYKVYEHLISRDPRQAWTSGQWMTERPGGSDVSNTESVAYETSEGLYDIKGFKWFSSATDSEVTVTLAYRDQENGKKEGLSCFLGDVHGSLEKGGIRLHRLKQKFGTKALPTAELELTGLNAQLIGEPGKGVKTIAAVLNITRIHSAIGSLGSWRRAYNIAKSYSQQRSVFGNKLCNVPAHVRILANIEYQMRGYMLISFYAAYLMGKVETGQATREEMILIRIIPGLAKAKTCKAAVTGISECMEALGGVGFLEHDVRFNMGRLYTDSQVNCIWEGTTNVLCDDMVRYMKRAYRGIRPALEWLLKSKSDGGELSAAVMQRFANWKQVFANGDLETCRRQARDIVFELSDIIVCSLACADASDANGRAVAEKWVYNKDPGYSTDRLVVYGPTAHL